LDRALEDTIPYLFSLLSIVEGDDPLAQMDGQIKKQRDARSDQTHPAARESQPAADGDLRGLHWIDSETQELLNLLADSIGSAKILLLVNYRPEYRHEWGNRTHYTQLRLDSAGKEGAEEMLSALLGDGPDPATFEAPDHRTHRRQPVLHGRDVQVLFDEGALARDGTVKLTNH